MTRRILLAGLALLLVAGAVLARSGKHSTEPGKPRAAAHVSIISRGQPAFASGSGEAGNAVDSDYATDWRSITTPSAESPQWLAIDLNAVTRTDKRHVRAVYMNFTRPTVNPPVYYASARDWTYRCNASSSSSRPTSGWRTVVTISDYRLTEHISDELDLASCGWFELNVTASNGSPGNTDVGGQLDLRNVAAGFEDSILAYGDSITQESFNGTMPGNTPYKGGGLEALLSSATGRSNPVIINAGTGGWLAATGDEHKAELDGFPCKYVLLNFGTNDANNIGDRPLTAVELDAYQASMQSMIDYFEGRGQIVIVPTVPWGNANPSAPANTAALGTRVDALLAANPKVLPGPDLWALFDANHSLIRDGLHPSFDAAGGSAGGLVGYEHYMRAWRDTLARQIYRR
jgi:lysophospholipase L1-like esterase